MIVINITIGKIKIKDIENYYYVKIMEMNFICF